MQEVPNILPAGGIKNILQAKVQAEPPVAASNSLR